MNRSYPVRPEPVEGYEPYYSQVKVSHKLAQK